jgi:type II secretory pathway pseudopilin PulG
MFIDIQAKRRGGIAWSKRRALTLLETLVAFAIIGILIALTAPAIQRVRETANAAVCASNIRQVAVAAHAFHSDFGRLPPGYLGPSKSREADFPAFFNEGQWIGHLPMLLPYLSDGALFQDLSRRIRFDVDYVAPFPWFRMEDGSYPNGSAYRAARVIQRLFRCPSATPYQAPIGVEGRGTVVGFHVFHSMRNAVMTPYWLEKYENAAQFYPLGRTHYIGVAGAGTGDRPEEARYEGIYTNRSVNSLAQLSAMDGASNTLMYGECCGSRGRNRNAPQSVDIAWAGAGALGTFNGIERGRHANVDTFASFHPKGVHFAMADGAIRVIRHGLYRDDRARMLSWYILQELAGIRDGGGYAVDLIAD